jgi:RimJ/RimL family protein N-acetyltransferase
MEKQMKSVPDEPKSSLKAHEFCLEPLRNVHKDLLLGTVLVTEDDITYWLGDSYFPSAIDKLEQFISEQEQQWLRGFRYCFIACRRDRTECFGLGWIENINLKHLVGDLGCWVRSDCRRRGHGISTMRHLAEYGFKLLGMKRLQIVVDAENFPGQELAVKSGAVNEATLRNRLHLRGESRKALMFSLLSPEVEIKV